jgi:hypothetical protein
LRACVRACVCWVPAHPSRSRPLHRASCGTPAGGGSRGRGAGGG